jgi:hypothetical protein
MELSDITKSKWSQFGQNFYSNPEGIKSDKIPPGVYKIVTPLDKPWFLSMERNRFVIPFKVYGLNNKIISRVKKAWEKTDSTLGVLFNGLKGSGKTVTAQILCNDLIDKGYPIIVCDHYTPVLDILIQTCLKQDAIFMFDEFEKNFKKPKEDSDNGDPQQRLLSVIDGLGKTSYKKMFIFTTNEEKIDENLIDRPSRIRYKFLFDDMSPEVAAEIIDDVLDPSLVHLREGIIAYVNNLSAKSIDAIKSLVGEVNLFEESPSEFGDFFNLSKKTPSSYTFSGRYKIYPSKFNSLKIWLHENNISQYRGYNGTTEVSVVSEDYKERVSDIYVISISESKIRYIPRYKKSSDGWWNNLSKEIRSEIFESSLSSFSNDDDDDDDYDDNINKKLSIDKFMVLRERNEETERKIVDFIMKTHGKHRNNLSKFSQEVTSMFFQNGVLFHPYGNFEENLGELHRKLFQAAEYRGIPFQIITSDVEPNYESSYIGRTSYHDY